MSTNELSKLKFAKYLPDCNTCLGIGCIYCRIKEENHDTCSESDNTPDSGVPSGLYLARQGNSEQEERRRRVS